MVEHMSIQEVSERTGLPKSTLRYWEKEFNTLITPTRTPGGQRRYSHADLDIISAIHNYKKMGYSLTQIKAQIPAKPLQRDRLSSSQIDQLAERIAGAVRREINNYFDQQPKPLAYNTAEESAEE